MAAFSSLTDRLSNAFKHLKSKGKLSDADIDGTIREIRRALLDADVSLDVVRSFTARVRDRALSTEVSEALNPAQQVVRIVNDELTDILGQGVCKAPARPRSPANSATGSRIPATRRCSWRQICSARTR